MAVLSQLISESELKQLPEEEVEIILSMAKAGGTVAEYFDSKRLDLNDIGGANFRRLIEPELQDLLARMNFEEVKEKLR